jgi:hypothetical protein
MLLLEEDQCGRRQQERELKSLEVESADISTYAGRLFLDIAPLQGVVHPRYKNESEMTAKHTPVAIPVLIAALR